MCSSPLHPFSLYSSARSPCLWMDGGVIMCVKCQDGCRQETRLQSPVDVNRKREIEYVPEEWRVVTGLSWWQGNGLVVLLSIWIVVVVVRWGSRRTFCYNMENNMVNV